MLPEHILLIMCIMDKIVSQNSRREDIFVLKKIEDPGIIADIQYTTMIFLADHELYFFIISPN